MLFAWIPLLIIFGVLTSGVERGPGSMPSPRNVQSTPGEREPSSSVRPHPDLSPADVVRIQVAALGKNDAPHIDAGIATAFRFASPGNKRSTGPLARFRLIARSPTYRPLLDHVRAEYGGVRQRGDEVALPVIVTTPAGRRVGYTFFLSKQTHQPFRGCWMTDGVVRFRVPQKRLPPPHAI